MSFTLTPDSAGAYLDRRTDAPDVTGPVEAAALGGGVSNRVVMVRTDDDCLVLKQPRPNLNVEADWPADVDRVHNEAAATRAYETALGSADLPATVPAVRFEDDENDVVGFECAPDDARMWKADLLDGRVDGRVAEAVGRVLGTVHGEMADDPARLAPFESKLPFDQLRIDPYHRTVARRHPDVADAVEAATERLLDSERTLVHGDYSPKNVLVEDEGTFRVWILDFEVAHRGDPTFDTAFMLNHLFIKSVYNADRGAEYREAARAFFDAYGERVPWDIEAETVEELGVLMLARVDGKSPVEYVEREETKETLRRIAKRTLTEPIRDLEAFERLVRTEAA
jgi:5-methylthioribose kinase